jgi:sugar transferase (PEP-CTERM/EpsH1 system associated)
VSVSPPNVLHLAHRLPYPPDKGDRIRSFHTLRHLAGRARVHLACLADEAVPEEARTALEGLCARVAIVPVSGWGRKVRALLSLLRGRTATEGAFQSPVLRWVLREWTRDTPFDAALASASSMVPYLQQQELRSVPAVVDLVDVDSQKWLDYAAVSRWPAAWLYRTEGRRLRRLEQTLPAWTRGVVLTTPAEVALYEQFAGPGTARAVANGVDLDCFRPAPQSLEPACVFVGALDYRPNVDGIGWFCSEVWPKLWQRRRDARLFIVGRRPTEAVRRLKAVAGVEVVGTVPDVRPWLSRAAVVLVPLRIARGVQNKVLEALAMGRAVLATPLCLQGMLTEPGRHLLTATAPNEWLAELERLLDDEGLRRRLGEAGRAFVEEHHCWESCLEPLLEMLASRGRKPPEGVLRNPGAYGPGSPEGERP